MYDYKAILGVLTIVIAIISYSNYFFNIFKGCTIPRTASWFIWGILNTIAFILQYNAGAGSGAWVTGFTALMCLAIAVIAYVKCREHFTIYDWVPLCGALITLLFWWFTSNPVVAIILTAITYAIGFIPTIHNAYLYPKQETVTTFALNGFKFLIALFALDSYSLATWLYPVTLVMLNILLVSVILLRRRKTVI